MTSEMGYLDGSDGEGNLPPAINVRVQNTKNVLELLRDDQRLKGKTKKRNICNESHTAAL